MAIIAVINELNIGAVTGPAARQVAQPLFLPGIDTQHRYAAGTGLAAQGSDQPELPVAFMWLDVTGTQRLAQGTTPIAGPHQQLSGGVATDVIPTRQHLLRQLHRLEVGPVHRFIGRAAGTVGFEHLVYHFPQPRLALGDLATTTNRTYARNDNQQNWMK